MVQAPIAEVEAPPAKGGEAVSLQGGLEEDMAAFYRENYSADRLASALEYVRGGGLLDCSRLKEIERNLSRDLDDITRGDLLREKRRIESGQETVKRAYGETAKAVRKALIGKLGGNLSGRERGEVHRVLLSGISSPVVHVYHDGGEKVLVLDDVVGRVLEVEGHVRLPHNVVSPNGNPLTSRAATNLCIENTPDGGIFGVYRGYGKAVGGKNEGRSSPFAVFFNEDLTPIKPLPQEPLFPREWKEEQFGDEDMRIVRSNGNYFGAYVVARETADGIEYGGAGAIFSLDLKVEDRYLFQGLPSWAKDFVPRRGKVNGYHIMEFRPSPPERVKNEPGYSRFWKEHPGIWLARSDDLRTWEIVGEILRPLEGESKIGGGSPPVGNWEYIHGVRGEDKDWRDYSGRAVLFEEGNPTKPIRMTPDFLKPEDPCDRNDEYKIRHMFPMGAVGRLVEVQGRRYEAHIVSVGTADKYSSLCVVLVPFLEDISKPMDAFNYTTN